MTVTSPSTDAPSTPIAPDLFTQSDPPVLLGGRCAKCSAISFPRRPGCPSCGGQDVVSHELGSSGTLYTWTSQGFPPKAPYRGELGGAKGFTPWYVGLVELPGQLRVESLLVDCTEDNLTMGMSLRLVLTHFRTDEETGAEVVTFAFAPAAQETPDA